MVAKSELMATGLPALAADHLGQDPFTHLTPGADSQGGTPLTSNFTILDTASAGSVTLPQARGKAAYVIFNNSGQTQKVYPATGETINAGSANAAFSLTSAKSLVLYASGNAWIANMSA